MERTDPTAESQVENGNTALAEGRDQDAEVAFRAALDISPNFTPANYHMGLLKLGGGLAADGLPFLQKAAKAQPTTKTLTALGNCFETLGAFDQAIRCYRPVLDKTPEDSNLWAQYANLLQSLGQESGAIEAYNNALTHNPGHAQAATKLGWILWKETPQEAIHVLKITLDKAGNLADRVTLLSVIVLFEEWSARLSKTLMPYHATSLEELFFHHATETLKEFKSATALLVENSPGNSWALMTDGLATFASGKLDAAQDLFARVTDQSLNAMAQAIRFDQPFFDELEKATDSDLTARLPNVETIKEASFIKSDILYMSCNDTYFDLFAKPLLRSLAANGPGSEVHIHLMDSTQEHTETALIFCSDLPDVRTALSVERPDFLRADLAVKRAYFHAIRFIRYYHHFLEYQRSLWLMDVDGLFNTSPEDLFLSNGNTDISFRARPGRLEPWNQFNACLVGTHPTSAATKYLHQVAAYIAHFYHEQNLPWGIDQLAMYAAFINLQKHGAAPQVSFLGDKVLDYEYLGDSILWCSSGVGKLSSSGGRNIEDNLKTTAYDRAFERYQS